MSSEASLKQASAAPRRRTWPPSTREATGHAVVLAVCLWTVGAIIVLVPQGLRDLRGSLKGADFVHFYAVGTAIRDNPSTLYDHEALHDLQAVLVPASSPEWYLSVYPPQTALVFAPLSTWPYGVAATFWAMINICCYSVVTLLAAQSVPLPRATLVAALAAFPPFWQLVWHGQTTAFPLLAFGLGGAALLNGWRLRAGLAFGLLAMKPQLGVALAIVFLVGREWRIVGGILLSCALQFALVWMIVGLPVWAEYGQTLLRLPEFREALEPRPELLHSIAALTKLLPAKLQLSGWLAISALVVYHTSRAWRSASDLKTKLALLLVATILVSPHLNIYDASLLALPLLWAGATISGPAAEKLVTIIYVLILVFLVPTAAILPVQASVLAMLWLFYFIVKTTEERVFDGASR